MARRKRRFGSVAEELVKKAREAMLTAVQIFNNPQIEFQAELFIVSTVIAWPYLLHGFYRKQGVEYRQHRMAGKRKRFFKTKFGAERRWTLEDCLGQTDCPLDGMIKKNLMFLIGIRHEIEHQMTTRIDDQLSAKFQAAAMNFNSTIKTLFGSKYSLDAEQAFSIQFSGIDEGTAKILLAQPDLPQHIRSFIAQFESELSQEEYDDQRFSYRVAFVRKTTSSKTAADKVVEFVAPDSEAATEINKVFLKETEKVKYRPSTIVNQMKAEGFTKFGMQHHTELWKGTDARNPKFHFGVNVEGTWFWYESWMTAVRKYCTENGTIFKIVEADDPDDLNIPW
jgi:hypothetical protein